MTPLEKAEGTTVPVVRNQSLGYRILTFGGRDPSGLLPFSGRSWLYYFGVALFAGKLLATALLFAHLDTAYGLADVWYWLGKATPTLLCVAFALDALIYRRDRRAFLFWSWAFAVVLVVTIVVLEILARR